MRICVARSGQGGSPQRAGQYEGRHAGDRSTRTGANSLESIFIVVLEALERCETSQGMRSSADDDDGCRLVLKANVAHD